jgi:hypothetical protein
MRSAPGRWSCQCRKTNTGLRTQEGNPEEDKQRRMVFLQLRVNTVERIARRDPELALSFFRNTELPPLETTGDINERNYRLIDERALELGLARQMADNNPEIALSLGRSALSTDISGELIPLLRQLNRKHPDQAQILFSEIVDKLKQIDLQSEPGAFSFASNLATSFASAATNNAAWRELANVFINAAETYGCHKKPGEDDQRSYFCSQIGRLLPLFDKVNGQRAAPAETVAV